MPTSRTWRQVTRTLGAALVLAVPACGGGGPTVAEVAGSVTLDGQPVPEGAIQFIPTDGASPTAGAVISGGQYKAKVPVGDAKVSITAQGKPTGTRKDPASGMEVPITEESVPAKYNTESTLKVTVSAGPNSHDFPLVTEKGEKKK